MEGGDLEIVYLFGVLYRGLGQEMDVGAHGG